MSIPKTYCPKAFNNLHAAPTIGSPCCLFFNPSDSYAIGSDSIADMFNHPVMNRIRQDMLDGKYIKGCEQCYETESRGIKSARQQAIEQFGMITTPELYELNISFSNVCNLKCRMCSSINAHLIKPDEIKIYGKPLTRVDKKYTPITSLENFNYKTLKHAIITGGEPFLNKSVETFLNRLIDDQVINNITLSINTNATVYPSDDVINALTLTKETQIILSIDAIGPLNDFQRGNSDFNKILELIEFYKQLHSKHPNIKLGINSTVSIYTVHQLESMLDFFNEHCPEFELMRRPVDVFPETLSIQNMPADLKAQVIELLTNSKYNFADIIDFIKNPGSDLFEHFLNYHFQLNDIRNESFDGLNPLLEEYINNFIQQHPTRVDSTEFFNKQADIMIQ
jgi:organic radical activating enzyme